MNFPFSSAWAGRKTAYFLMLVVAIVMAPWAHAQRAVPPSLSNPAVANWIQVDDQILPAYAVQPLAKIQRLGPVVNSATPPWVQKWLGGRVFYAFDSSATAAERANFVAACREWEKYANLRFAPRVAEPNYILVKGTANASNSYIGMTGGAQILNLADWADKFTAVHEIAHALGIIHEQSRPDRDTYVTINTANIQTGMEGNFSIVNGALNQGPYDFDSVMHYYSTAFSINGQPTITANPGYTQFQNIMGQSNHVSTLDASGMAQIYGLPQGIAIVNPAQGGTFGPGPTLAATTTYGEPNAVVAFAARPASLVQTRAPNKTISRTQVTVQTDPMTVSASGNVINAAVSVDISHEWRGVLELTLIAPDGTRTLFQPFTGISGVDLKQSYDVTAALAGKPIAGTYTLEVYNAYSGLGGNWNNWSLTFSQPFASVGTDSDGPNAQNQYTVPWNTAGLTPANYEVRATLTAGEFSAQAVNTARYVVPVNRAPVATASSFSSVSPASVNGQLSGTDADGDALTFAKFTDPTHGSVTVNANGSFFYSPAASYVGSDSFRFTASDGQATSAPATVTLTLKQGNRAPTLSDATFQATRGLAFSAQLAGSDADGDTLSYAVLPTAALPAGLTLSSSGLLSGTPTQAGTGGVTVEVSDGKGGTGTGRLTFNVALDTRPPTLAPTLTPTAPLTSQSVTVAPNATDPTGSGLSYAYTWQKNGAVIANETGATLDLSKPGNGDRGDVIAVQVTATNGNGGSASAGTQITVANTAPVAADASFTATQNSALAGQLSGSDADGDALTFAKISDPAHGSVTVNSNGSFSYTGTAGYVGSDSFGFGASDGSAQSNLARVSLTVNAAPNALNLQAATNLTAQQQNSSVVLSWTYNSSGESGTKVERRTGTRGPWVSLLRGTTPGQTSFTDRNVAPGNYFYRVYTYKSAVANGPTGDEVPVTVTAPIEPPPTTDPLAAPTQMTATLNSAGKVVVGWQDNATAETGYKVERKIGASGAWAEVSRGIVPNQTSFVDGAVIVGMSYSYRVRAYQSGVANGASGAEATITIAGTLPPVTSTQLTVTSETLQVRLEWSDDHALRTGFKIERSDFFGTQWTQIGRSSGPNQTSFVDTPTPGVLYRYRVRAYQISVANFPYSNEASGQALLPANQSSGAAEPPSPSGSSS